MAPDLRRRATTATELMDDPNCDAELLDRTYAQFPLVNRFVAGWRGIYRRDIRPLLSAERPSRLLDIGAGGADVPRALLAWAARDGLLLRAVAVDPDPRAYAWASARPTTGLQVSRAHSSELVADGERFDVVISNHVLHHLDDAELSTVLADSEELLTPGGIAVHSDIARSRFAYAAFAAGTWPFQSTLLRRSFIRADGLTSIRRSFTPGELRSVAPAGWVVRTGVPSRLDLSYRRAA
ncbi:class I SAM-dependent methyltransferase [Agromyces atrinae]|uniref:2-polyprenyl-3-methyl-5-hydroxy-6-metoxy-1, 4-benzoquinol methylase n=1 Tax=Agromyces atrinae TaxID=592376 RepID=A0A4V1R2P9_9MICO|nr:class I SAM-dependent methyltransferase [Agromyces atrinae]NYD67916.1 2-polyprenyl-3-methyl-5-hydroxy-6-metoxy-1,4-benzoquinol methylase [Agromyces atrinae]RXZ87916.1 methyltransferase domain-containing protein [Agromyces atrinae]